MGLRKMIIQPATPAGNPAQLRGKAALDFHFPAAGQIHASVRIHKDYRAIAKSLDDEPSVTGEFNPLRLIINLMITDQSNQAATSFPEPFELRIRYTSEDVAMAGSRDRLKLAYWLDKKWVMLTSTEHHFKVEDDEFLYTELSNWPSDPTIAIGH